MIERGYVVQCEGYLPNGAECDEMSEGWAATESEARQYAQKHEGFQLVDGRDLCRACAKEGVSPAVTP